MNEPCIAVAYSGVHQAFQLALAAHEEQLLQSFYCSIYDAPGKWGWWMRRLIGAQAMANRRIDGLPPQNVVEFPWPLLRKSVRDRVCTRRIGDWLATNDLFDRWAARQIQRKPPRVFVGGETCDLHCLETAKGLNLITVHDCPQLHPDFLRSVMREASENSGIRLDHAFDEPRMLERKLREYDLAEWLLVYSDIHRKSFTSAGFADDRIFECALWVDSDFWRPGPAPRTGGSIGSLKVLFVGSMTLRKGLPFLLRAIESCDADVSLTLAGPLTGECAELLKTASPRVKAIGAQTKQALQRIYRDHDVFVLPSVADSFGFVALEAMACGLPAIVTENCGAPVPDSAWRIPVMNVDALAERIALYAGDRDLVSSDGEIARRFASAYTPENYRKQIRSLFRRLLPGD